MSRTPARPVARATAALLLAVLLGGCTAEAGSGTSSTPPAEPPPVPASSAATTPVPAPTPGSAGSTVAGQPVRQRKAVRLDAPGQAADDVAVRLTSVRAITARASGPGEVAGPALAVTVQIENGTSQAVELGSTVVNLTDSEGAPGSVMSAEPASPLPAAVAAGAQVAGVYVFTVPEGRRDPVTVEVGVTPSDPLVVFRGRPTG
ncbi:hypothetical protein SAMN04488543_0351 [Friedmanniella luteola]|uniref:DUF4352 domain-containing protein n=1 Tax=Friedmanniella luteola TaxID=546871 RepID=A0A1H1LPF0_9ACTN|nr:hypothetical protein [Friedmanniella luteola]SDR75739.1 hypothetical protein SAMN04488543_0351 [Friedmanniella luteola]